MYEQRAVLEVPKGVNEETVIARIKDIQEMDLHAVGSKIENSEELMLSPLYNSINLYETTYIDKEWGTNPCCEIALRPYQFCNLTEVNASDLEDQEEYEARVKAAAFLGTLQAGYTDFHYLRDVWRRNTEKDALIGVSMTGIGSGKVLELDMESGAKAVKEENARVAELIGIRAAARTTLLLRWLARQVSR